MRKNITAGSGRFPRGGKTAADMAESGKCAGLRGGVLYHLCSDSTRHYHGKNGCSLTEHTHTADCYTQVTAVTRQEPICSLESLDLHEHTKDCFDENGEPVCGYADFVIHEHDASCYDEMGGSGAHYRRSRPTPTARTATPRPRPWRYIPIPTSAIPPNREN